jgi:hypothetical protein
VPARIDELGIARSMIECKIAGRAGLLHLERRMAGSRRFAGRVRGGSSGRGAPVQQLARSSRISPDALDVRPLGGARWPAGVQINNSSQGDIHMSTSAPTRDGVADRDRTTHPTTVRRLSTETKAAFKTTEFFAYAAVLVGILIAGAVVDSSDAGGYGARQVWLYATILTVGYMVSRGLAKSGSRDPYDADSRDR